MFDNSRDDSDLMSPSSAYLPLSLKQYLLILHIFVIDHWFQKHPGFFNVFNF